jgi:hypothetical protein
MGAEMARSLDAVTQAYQIYPNGMGDLMGNTGEFYIEQIGIVSVALSEALVQDHGPLIRIGPAIPPDWTMHGTVYVRGNARITVTAVDGKVTAFELAAASPHTFRIANPWTPGEVLTLTAKPGHSYPYSAPTTDNTTAARDALRLADAATTAPATASVTAPRTATRTPAAAEGASQTNMPSFAPGPFTRPKALGRAMIGIPVPCCAPPPDYDPATDRYPPPTPESH